MVHVESDIAIRVRNAAHAERLSVSSYLRRWIHNYVPGGV